MMDNHYLMNTYNRFDLIFDRGEGSWLFDSTGEKYLDFVAGIAVNCLGHCHPAIAETLASQSKKLMHISNLYWNTNQMTLAKQLVEASGLHQSFFCNSGAEANEAAIKLSRKYGHIHGGPEKNIIIHMKDSFHGRTIGALSITGQEKYQLKFKPLMNGVQQVLFNDIDDLKNAMSSQVCAVFIEPIQGESGVTPASLDYLKAAKELCTAYNALLIFDEVQCGIGRTGSLFAYQLLGVEPDAVTLAKGLGAGFPIGALIANKKAAEAFEPGDHGSTFGGNPLACTVALTVLDQLISHGIIDSIKDKSDYVLERLNAMKEKTDLITDIRGMGLILGIQFSRGAKDIIAKCLEKHLLLIAAGSDVIRLVPPLTISIEELEIGLAILEEAILEASAINYSEK
jgi:acetylornithine/N-succinyldiaminopimelate aminotransferase